jgi:hypothetical protein
MARRMFDPSWDEGMLVWEPGDEAQGEVHDSFGG